MSNNNEKIFRIVVDYKTASENLAVIDENLKNVNNDLRELTRTQKESNKQFKAGKIDQDAFGKQTIENADKSAKLRKEKILLQEQRKRESADIRVAVKEMAAEEKSVDKMRATLSRLKKEWSRMDTSMPEFEEKTKEIAALSLEIEELEAQIRVFGRKAGNYPEKGGFFGSVSVLGGNLLTKAISGITSLAGKAKDFIADGIHMAAVTEGVRLAFDKLDKPDLLNDLRKQTKGLVNDFELMKAAVRANNFNIPLEDLGSLLKFAQQRAQETGESVDYLTESIINGIGRKSTLVLDNLGLSATRVQDKVKETGDFAQATISIVNEELAKQGDLALTSADKATQASVKWENAQLAVGKRFKWLGNLWSGVSGFIADSLTVLAGNTQTLSEKFEDQLDKVASLEMNVKPLAKEYDTLTGKTELTADETDRLKILTEELARAYPGAITQIDRYGKALGISTQAIYDYIEAERARLEYIHSKQIKAVEDAISETQKKIAKLQNDANATTKKALTVNLISGILEYQIVDRTAKEIAADKKKAAEHLGDLNKLLLGQQTELKRLNGSVLEEHIKLREARDKFNGMNKEQLEAWIKDERNAQNEYLQIAKDILGDRAEINVSDEESLKKTREEAAKKAEDAARKHAEVIFSIIEDSREKELMSLDKDYADKLSKLQGNKDDEAKLAEWKERQISEINKKWNDKAFNEALNQESRMANLMEDGIEKELALLSINHRKKLSEAEGNALELLAVEDWYQREIAKLNKKYAVSSPNDKLLADQAKLRREYEAQARIIEKSDLGRQQKQKAIYDNELQYLQARYKVLETYLAELQAQDASEKNTKEIERIITQLAILRGEMEGFASQTSFMAKLFGIDDKYVDQIANEAFGIASMIGENIFNARQELNQRMLDSDLRAIDKRYDAEKKRLDKQKKYNVISEAEVERIEADKAAREEEARKAAFEREKRTKKQQIALETALGIARAWAESAGNPIPAGIKTAALLIAMGLQIDAVNRTQYAKGALLRLDEKTAKVQGRTHAQGGHRIYLDDKPLGEVERGELLAIVNARDSQKIHSLSDINSRHGRKFASGGLMRIGIPSPAPIPSRTSALIHSGEQMLAYMQQSREETKALIRAVNRRIDKLQVVVIESDITDTQAGIKKANVIQGF